MSSRKKLFLLLFLLLIFFPACNLLQGDKKLFQEKHKFLSNLQENKEYIKNISKALAFDPEISNVYKSLKEKVNDLNKVEANKEVFIEYGRNLKNVFNEIIRKYERDIGLPVRYNFYLPLTILWVIPDKPYGEDIVLQNKSSENLNIMEIFNKIKIVEGIVLKNDALIYSVATPIQSETGEILGAVEVWTDFLSLLDYYLYQNPKAKIIVVLKKEIANYFPSIPKEQTTDQGFILYSNLENINYQSIINKAISLKNESVIEINNKKFIIIDLFDFANKKIGQILFSPF